MPRSGWSTAFPAWFLTSDAPAVLDYQYALPMPACQDRPFFVALAVDGHAGMSTTLTTTWTCDACGKVEAGPVERLSAGWVFPGDVAYFRPTGWISFRGKDYCGDHEVVVVAKAVAEAVRRG